MWCSVRNLSQAHSLARLAAPDRAAGPCRGGRLDAPKCAAALPLRARPPRQAIPLGAEQNVGDLVREPFAAPVDDHAITSVRVWPGARQTMGNERCGAA